MFVYLDLYFVYFVHLYPELFSSSRVERKGPPLLSYRVDIVLMPAAGKGKAYYNNYTHVLLSYVMLFTNTKIPFFAILRHRE